MWERGTYVVGLVAHALQDWIGLGWVARVRGVRRRRRGKVRFEGRVKSSRPGWGAWTLSHSYRVVAVVSSAYAGGECVHGLDWVCTTSSLSITISVMNYGL